MASKKSIACGLCESAEGAEQETAYPAEETDETQRQLSSLAYFGWFFIFLGICAVLANSVGPFSKLWYPDGPRNERGVRVLIWSLFAIGIALMVAAFLVG